MEKETEKCPPANSRTRDVIAIIAIVIALLLAYQRNGTEARLRALEAVSQTELRVNELEKKILVISSENVQRQKDILEMQADIKTILEKVSKMEERFKP